MAKALCTSCNKKKELDPNYGICALCIQMEQVEWESVGAIRQLEDLQRTVPLAPELSEIQEELNEDNS